ncbi:MAG: hypothetical protein Kow00100_22460 [Geothermobacteraceae bacterium]
MATGCSMRAISAAKSGPSTAMSNQVAASGDQKRRMRPYVRSCEAKVTFLPVKTGPTYPKRRSLSAQTETVDPKPDNRRE